MFISVLVWIVAVFSLRMAIMGNQLSKVVKGLSEEDLDRLDKVAQEGTLPRHPGDEEVLRKFSWLALIDMSGFFLETALAFYFLVGEGEKLLAIVLIKNGIVMFLSIMISGRLVPKDGHLFSSIRKMPRWLLAIDRLSAAISAMIFIFLFLVVAGIVKS